jgi:hypothetical protein
MGTCSDPMCHNPATHVEPYYLGSTITVRVCDTHSIHQAVAA